MCKCGFAVWTVIALACLSGPGSINAGADSPGATTTAMHQLAQSENAFGFRLLEKLVSCQPDGSNVVISPFSVAVALTMTYNGAGGTTRDSIASTLGLTTMTTEQLNEGNRALRTYLKTLDQDVAFETAQSLWVDDGLAIAEDFRKVSEEYYAAVAANLELADPASAGTINEWVGAQTSGKVTEILETIPPDALIYLVSAVRLTGRWKYPFEADKTHDAAFTRADGSTVSCRMMTSRRLKLPYLIDENLGFQAVELPYGDSSLAMTIVLPEPEQDVNNLIASLDSANWADWTQRYQTAAVTLHLPKFVLESNYELSDALADLGMGVAFDPRKADFSAMIESESRSVFMSEVVHNAVIEVDEAGTEAGAGTVIEIKKMNRFEDVTLDRPFLFAIRDVGSGSILFLAKIADPTVSLI